jgi:hypothetical protein
MFFIEAHNAVTYLGSHADRLLNIRDLRLQDVEALVDDGKLFELRTLLACGVLGQDGFGSFGDECASVERSESEGSERP